MKLLRTTVEWLRRLSPDAAASLEEGLEESLTVVRLNVPALLRKTLSTTNPIESAYLGKKDSPERFVKFVAAVQETGYDAALREHYSIDGAGSLSHLWHSMSERKHISVVMNVLKARDPMPTTSISRLGSLSSDH